MKKLLVVLFAALCGGLFLNGCSNDFELTADWKEVPVVYAILSPSDENHYVRIEKAFLDPTTSALKIAKIADSLYYREDEISVFLQKKGEATLYPLTRVDGNLEGVVRDTGIFANAPNWLYRIRNFDLPGGLRGQSTYRLVIKRKDGRPDITAETTIPKDMLLISPTPTNTPPVMAFLDDANSSIRWAHDENAVYFNVTLTFPYREQREDGTLIGRDTIVWEVTKNLLADDNANGNSLVLIKGYDFYDMLDRVITTPRDGRVRVFGTTAGIKIEGGGKEIREYRLTAEANSGLTGAEIVQTYTNLSEGLGVFSAKNVEERYIFRITKETIEAMNNYDKTRTLNFKIL